MLLIVFPVKSLCAHRGHSKYSVLFLLRPRSQEGHRRKEAIYCQNTLREQNTQDETMFGAVTKH